MFGRRGGEAEKSGKLLGGRRSNHTPLPLIYREGKTPKRELFNERRGKEDRGVGPNIGNLCRTDVRVHQKK